MDSPMFQAKCTASSRNWTRWHSKQSNAPINRLVDARLEYGNEGSPHGGPLPSIVIRSNRESVTPTISMTAASTPLRHPLPSKVPPVTTIPVSPPAASDTFPPPPVSSRPVCAYTKLVGLGTRNIFCACCSFHEVPVACIDGETWLTITRSPAEKPCGTVVVMVT